MRKVAERVPWFLSSLGVALLVVGLLLGPAGQGQSHAQGTGFGGTCPGESTCDPNSNCKGSFPNCKTNACDYTNNSCGSCYCELVGALLGTKACNCIQGGS